MSSHHSKKLLKGHRRSASIGSTIDRIFRPQASLDKAKSANTSLEKEFGTAKTPAEFYHGQQPGRLTIEEWEGKRGERRRVGSASETGNALLEAVLSPRPVSHSPKHSFYPEEGPG